MKNKKETWLKRKEAFNIIFGHITEYQSPLTPQNVTLKEDFVDFKAISEILTNLGVSVDTY